MNIARSTASRPLSPLARVWRGMNVLADRLLAIENRETRIADLESRIAKLEEARGQ